MRYFILLVLLIFNSSTAQELFKDLGLGQTQETILSYTLSNGKFVIGTSPNGHIYTFEPSTYKFEDKKIVLEKFREAHIWTICSDDNGMVYGATSGGKESAAVFIYNPLSNELKVIKLKEIGLSEETFIFSSTNSNDDVYFGTYPGGKLLRFNKSKRILEYIITPLPKKYVKENFNSIYRSILSQKPGYDGETYIRCLTVGPNGKIFGGTEHGFIFIYDPKTQKYECLNINEQIGSSTLGTLYYLESNKNYIFGGITGSEDIGVFQLRRDSKWNVKKLIHPKTKSIIQAGYLKLVNDVLYISSNGGYKYNLKRRTLTKINFGGKYVKCGENLLCVLYTHNLRHKFAYYNLNNEKIKIDILSEPSTKLFPSGGSSIKALTADSNFIYGGVYLTGNFLIHDQRKDIKDNSVIDLGYSGGANADALIENSGMIYLGLYPNLSLGIYNPKLGNTSLMAKVGKIYQEPTKEINPLLRPLRKDDYGSYISDQNLVRITCFALDKKDKKVYIGTGPSTINTANENSWIIQFEVPNGKIRHLKNLLLDIKNIKDMAFYNKFLFVLGEAEDIIATIDVGNPEKPKVRFAEAISSKNIYVDDKLKKIYISVGGNSLRIYRIEEVLGNGFLKSKFKELHFKKHITDIIKGNDGFIYVSYRSWLGLITGDDKLIEVGRINPQNPYSDTINCLTVSKDTRNKRIYMGGSDGHFYVFLRELWNPEFKNNR